MKSILSYLFIGISGSLFFIGSQSALASSGGGRVGGGDIQCDNLIQNLSYQDPQGNLESWLQNDGPEKQNPKLDLSSSLNPDTGKPYTASEYEKAMIALIERFKKAPDVNCVIPGDKGYPVDVNDTSKICATSVDDSGVHIKCDRDLFMKLTTDEQIQQDHHEFAINVPGLEPDSGPISTYKISRQLSNSISSVVERRLVVRPGSVVNPTPNTHYQAGSMGFGNFYCYNVDSKGAIFGDPVEDSLCHVSYAVGSYSDGTNQCLNQDKNGVTYGKAVDAKFCSVGFRAGSMGMERTFYCYNQDAKGSIFGPRVEDSVCHASYAVGPYSDGTNQCLNKDAYGITYGEAVDPGLCLQ